MAGSLGRSRTPRRRAYVSYVVGAAKVSVVGGTSCTVHEPSRIVRFDTATARRVGAPSCGVTSRARHDERRDEAAVRRDRLPRVRVLHVSDGATAALHIAAPDGYS